MGVVEPGDISHGRGPQLEPLEGCGAFDDWTRQVAQAAMQLCLPAQRGDDAGASARGT